MEILFVDQLTQHIVKMFALALGAFLLTMALTPVYTFVAYKYRFWKKPRETSTTGELLSVFTKLHAKKHERHIPTMAGIVFVTIILCVTLVANYSKQQTLLPLAALLGGALVGLIDDIINIRGNEQGIRGMRSSIKFLLIVLLSSVCAWYFFSKLGYHSIFVPYFGNFELGWWIIPIFIVTAVTTSNAVNISDGLDGLAGGLLIIAYGMFGVIALLQGNYGIAGFCLTVVGALLSYTWFNIYPARFFMGDVGSFALGMGLGVVAMLTDTMFLLPVIGVIFVIEGGSSLLQVLSKKLRHGKKIFLAAPIHHHFEAIGWPETKVTMRFWVIGGVASFIGLLIALTGGYI